MAKKKRKLPSALKAYQFKKGKGKTKTGKSAKGRSGRSGRSVNTGSAPGVSAGSKRWGKGSNKRSTGTAPGRSAGHARPGSQKRSAVASVKGARPAYRNSAG